VEHNYGVHNLKTHAIHRFFPNVNIATIPLRPESKACISYVSQSDTKCSFHIHHRWLEMVPSTTSEGCVRLLEFIDYEKHLYGVLRTHNEGKNHGSRPKGNMLVILISHLIRASAPQISEAITLLLFGDMMCKHDECATSKHTDTSLSMAHSKNLRSTGKNQPRKGRINQ